MKPKNISEEIKDDDVFRLTKYGCLVAVMSDYGINLDHITPAIGEHLVDDFFECLAKQGYLQKVDPEDEEE